MDRPVRFGIIGLGGIANHFARTVSNESSTVLYAVASRDIKKAEEFKAKYNAEKAYGSYEDLCKDPMVDAVYIATPHNYHFENASCAIQNGKAVLCEKAMTVSQKEAEVLFALAKEHNVLLVEGMWTHMLPTFKKVKEWIKEGKIGSIRYMDITFCLELPYNPEGRVFSPALAGGSLMDTGVYALEFALNIMEKEPISISGKCTHTPTGVDAFSAVTLDFGECVANCASAISLNAVNDAYIYGDKGRIYLPDFHSGPEAVLEDSDGQVLDRFSVDFDDGFVFQVQHFVDCYNRGLLENPYVPAWETIAAGKIYDECFRQWGRESPQRKSL